MRTRVVIINNEIFPYRVPLFATLSSLEGLDVHVLFLTRRGWDRSWNLSQDVLTFPHTVLPGFFFRLPKPHYHEWRTIYVNPTLLWHLFRLAPNVVVGYEYSLPALTALLYSRLSRCRYVVCSECTAWSDRALTHGQRLTRRIIIPRASAYLGTSPAACANLVDLGAPADRISEAPQSHDVQSLRERVERARALVDRHPPTLLYVGGLSERKGVDLVLEAFGQVARELPQARLILAGSGALRTSLERQASRMGLADRVEFLGFVEPDDLPRVFAEADVLASPSLEDTFGMVVVEAWASGVPVVCSKYAGVSGYITEGRDGFVVDSGRIEEMAGKILILLRDPALRRSFAGHGQILADRFDPVAVAERFRQAILASQET